MPVRDSQLTIIGAKYELTEENFFFKKVYASNEYIDREVSVTLPRWLCGCLGIAKIGGRMESLLVVLLVANLAGLFLIWQRQDKQEKYLTKSLEDQADNLSDQLDYRFEQARQASQLDQKILKWQLVTVCRRCGLNCTKV